MYHSNPTSLHLSCFCLLFHTTLKYLICLSLFHPFFHHFFYILFIHSVFHFYHPSPSSSLFSISMRYIAHVFLLPLVHTNTHTDHHTSRHFFAPITISVTIAPTLPSAKLSFYNHCYYNVLLLSPITLPPEFNLLVYSCSRDIFFT